MRRVRYHDDSFYVERQETDEEKCLMGCIESRVRENA